MHPQSSPSKRSPRPKQLPGDLMIAGVVGETCHANVAQLPGVKRYRGCGVGARFMVANGISADMVVIPEPTSNRISVASGGYVFFELTTRGNPGATYQPRRVDGAGQAGRRRHRENAKGNSRAQGLGRALSLRQTGTMASPPAT